MVSITRGGGRQATDNRKVNDGIFGYQLIPSRDKSYLDRRRGPGDRGVWRPRVPDPEAPTDILLRFFGRTDLRIDARLLVQPPQLAQKGETQVPRSKIFVETNFLGRKVELTGIL